MKGKVFILPKRQATKTLSIMLWRWNSMQSTALEGGQWSASRVSHIDPEKQFAVPIRGKLRPFYSWGKGPWRLGGRHILSVRAGEENRCCALQCVELYLHVPLPHTK
jgi:hypothetical protein